MRFYGDEEDENDTYYYTDDFGSLTGSRATLNDDDGSDTINAAAVTGSLTLDLAPGATSTIDGRSVVIAAGTVIEIVYSGDGNDTVHGNTADNHLLGGRGNDTLTGAIGHDILDGEDGQDHVYGDEGNDTLEGGHGNDMLDGGAGLDTALFSGARSTYTFLGIDGSVQVTGPDGVDILTNIELLAFDDGTIGAPVAASLGDVLWLHTDGTVAIAKPQSRRRFPTTGSIAGTGDFDGDGDSDILWRHRDGLVVTWEMENGEYVDQPQHRLRVDRLGDRRTPATSTPTATATSCGATATARW